MRRVDFERVKLKRLQAPNLVMKLAWCCSRLYCEVSELIKPWHTQREEEQEECSWGVACYHGSGLKVEEVVLQGGDAMGSRRRLLLLLLGPGGWNRHCRLIIVIVLRLRLVAGPGGRVVVGVGISFSLAAAPQDVPHGWILSTSSCCSCSTCCALLAFSAWRAAWR